MNNERQPQDVPDEANQSIKDPAGDECMLGRDSMKIPNFILCYSFVSLDQYTILFNCFILLQSLI